MRGLTVLPAEEREIKSGWEAAVLTNAKAGIGPSPPPSGQAKVHPRAADLVSTRPDYYPGGDARPPRTRPAPSHATQKGAGGWARAATFGLLREREYNPASGSRTSLGSPGQGGEPTLSTQKKKQAKKDHAQGKPNPERLGPSRVRGNPTLSREGGEWPVPEAGPSPAISGICGAKWRESGPQAAQNKGAVLPAWWASQHPA